MLLFPRILDEHRCIYSCLQIPPRENWFQYVRREYATSINFPCISTLLETLTCKVWWRCPPSPLCQSPRSHPCRTAWRPTSASLQLQQATKKRFNSKQAWFFALALSLLTLYWHFCLLLRNCKKRNFNEVTT